MPELPEVETVRRGLTGHMAGARIDRVEQRRENLRFPFPPDFCQRLTGATIQKLERRAKYLLAFLSNDDVLVMHLGMSGRFSVLERGEDPTAPDPSTAGFVTPASRALEKHDHVVLHLSSGVEIRYNDARRFGFMLLVEQGRLQSHKFFEKLGVEPLGEGLTADYIATAARGKKTGLKAFLLNQHIIAGLGNIYVCEILFRSGLSPFDPALVLAQKNNTARLDLLVSNIRAVLEEAIASGGSTLKDHRQTDGSLGYFQHTFRVYGQEGKGCTGPDCTATIQREQQGGRSTFFCPDCQPGRG